MFRFVYFIIVKFNWKIQIYYRYCVCRQSQSFRLEQKKFNSLPTMDKKRSKLWGFFTQTKDDKAKCDLCHSLYSVKGGSTTNLKKHLMKKHRPTYETIVPGSVSVAAALEAPTSANNAANMKAAIRLTNYEHLPCISHTVNLVVRAGVQVCGLEELIKKIKAIVEHFHKSPMATKKLIAMQEQLRPNQKPLKLKMDVMTRWNSTLDMIERIWLLQEPLEASLGILHNPVENLSESEWQTRPEIIKNLKPFKQLTEEMSSEKK
ncbi:unnamed protein product [Chilo suppressalis]|uniref:BED-type domain-containing protein n=1 Tax=Chilo suppressalis TaxID=168631 RepID=A0ABN8AVU1_CHISP|nr:unnamed protein product [Chilo suppressalis]